MTIFSQSLVADNFCYFIYYVASKKCTFTRYVAQWYNPYAGYTVLMFSLQHCNDNNVVVVMSAVNFITIPSKTVCFNKLEFSFPLLNLNEIHVLGTYFIFALYMYTYTDIYIHVYFSICL